MIKKLMLGLGTIATTIPVATIVSCGDDKIVPKDDSIIAAAHDPQTPTDPVGTGTAPIDPTGAAPSPTQDDHGLADMNNMNPDAWWPIELNDQTHVLTIDVSEGKKEYYLFQPDLARYIHGKGLAAVKAITSIVVTIPTKPAAKDIALQVGAELSGLADDADSDAQADAILAIIVKALESGGALEHEGLDSTWLLVVNG